jgi:hypothetical protein
MKKSMNELEFLLEVEPESYFRFGEYYENLSKRWCANFTLNLFPWFRAMVGKKSESWQSEVLGNMFKRCDYCLSTR